MATPAELLAQLDDPRCQAFCLLNDLVHADREARTVRAAAARDLAELYPPQRAVHRHAVELCTGAIAMLEELRQRLTVNLERSDP